MLISHKTYLENEIEYPSYYKIVANGSFLVFLFFSIFGTALPFRPEATSVDDIGTSNIVNQVVYSTLFLTSVFALIPVRRKLLHFILKEKFISIFLIWCLISLLWSDYSFVSFKRLFQVYTYVLVTLAFLFHMEKEEELINAFKYILYPYIVISVIVCLVVPGAKDPDFHTWRGLTSQKNMLGQIALLSVIFCFIFYKYADSLNSKVLSLIMMLFSIVLMFGSMSSTAILIFLILLGFGIIYSTDKIFHQIGLGRAVSTSIIGFIVLSLLSVYLFSPEVYKIIPQLFGKDETFSGRTDLWTYMFFEISKHPLIGAGYQSFWVVDNINLLILYEMFVWLPNQAHNGFIDILNELGLIGLLLLIAFIIVYFIRLIRLREKHYWKWFMIVAVISNFQESTLFRPGALLGIVVIITYLLLTEKLIRSEKL
ncbi:MAG: O-antigen ligase family protein [Ignavibacteriaceae bacterium]